MLTNINNLSLSIAVWLADNDYDHVPSDNQISATSLLKSTKSILLGNKCAEQTDVDISSLVPSRMGTAIHTAIETAWLRDNLKETLKALGHPKGVIERIRINPNPEEVTEDMYPVYMEIRSEKEIDGFKVSGKFDFVSDGVLEDFKSTGTYGWINQSNKDKYIKQGSIYRWLNPDIITEDYMKIQYIFTDWSAAKAKQDKDYPQSRIITEEYPLMPLALTEQFIRSKLAELTKYAGLPQEDMPECTDDELWVKPPVYKYYKNPANKTRSTKNFDTYWEAHKRFSEDGSIGEIVTVEGSVGFCRYCPAVNVCSQAQRYIDEGRLVL